MQNYIDNLREFGDVPEGGYVDIEFLKIENPEVATRIEPGCAACTEVFDQPDKTIVRFKASDIAPQVREAGHNRQGVDRFVTMTYQNGTEDILYFTGYIVPKDGNSI